jgi:hypothetical protein
MQGTRNAEMHLYESVVLIVRKEKKCHTLELLKAKNDVL